MWAVDDPCAYYAQEADLFKKRQVSLAKKDRWYSAIRLGLFLLALLSVIFSIRSESWWMLVASIVVFTIVFILVLLQHRSIRRQKHLAWKKEKLLREEIARCKGHLQGLPDGNIFMPDTHDYAHDLDLFGSNSLYQWLSRAQSSGGKNLVAQWMLEAAPPEQCLIRQNEINELAKNHPWLLHFLALLPDQPASHTKQKVKQGLTQGFNLHLWMLPFCILISGVTISLIGQLLFHGIGVTSWWVWLIFLIHYLIFIRLSRQLNHHEAASGQILRKMNAYREALKFLEESPWENQDLQKKQQTLKRKNKSASGALKRLDLIIHFLDARLNMLYRIIDLLLLIPAPTLYMLQRWEKHYLDQIDGWRQTLYHFDALGSLACVRHAFPDYQFPVFSDKACLLQGNSWGHPLIPAKERVTNNFTMKGCGNLVLITGSNMSGKSTFLRTLGINLVLARMGAPVCASDVTLSPVKLFTSMRTQDDLETHVSSFYAELKRIRRLLDLLNNSSEPVFYVLDELLKGTNSDDRFTGSKALMLQLKSQEGMGLISTHDLGLTHLEIPELENYNFSSEVVDGKLSFSYQLKPGPCRSFNALDLMASIGITLKKE